MHGRVQVPRARGMGKTRALPDAWEELDRNWTQTAKKIVMEKDKAWHVTSDAAEKLRRTMQAQAQHWEGVSVQSKNMLHNQSWDPSALHQRFETWKQEALETVPWNTPFEPHGLQLHDMDPKLAAAMTVPMLLAMAHAWNHRTLGTIADTNQLPYRYEVDIIRSYYGQRPMDVARRSAELASRAAGFGSLLLFDYQAGKWDENMRERAVRARELITEAGPAFIKVAQAVSIRPDILPPIYIEELQKLQDRVPPFDALEARKILEDELQVPLVEIFEDLSVFELPVAAASLGQVYKARLVSGEEVAVKVQRPGMLKAVTMDLHIIREALTSGTGPPFPEDFRSSCRGMLSVIDTWAGRFVEELDYIQEAQNAVRFESLMSKIPVIKEALVVPKPFTELTTRNVLVSEWVDGKKISELDVSSSEEKKTVKKQLAVLLNCYLAQLLDTGFLHADPHPGNFLSLKDGRICILDYGLMTEVTEDQRLALVEYVTHLSAKEYSNTLGDLVKLGFIPEEVQSDPEKRDIVAPLLGSVLEQLSQGGGAANINVDVVGRQVEELAEYYPIVIPAYFGLIVRAFSTLEGIGLTADPTYSIVDECFPYLCRRLLTDDSARMREALRTFLYGDKKQLSVARVEEMATGFQTFTNAMEKKSLVPVAMNGRGGSPKVQELDPVLKEGLVLLFDRKGNYVQELLVEEAVRSTDALMRSVVAEAWKRLGSITSSSPTAALFRSPFAPALFLPPFAPLSLVSRFAATNEFVRLSEEDVKALETLQGIVSLLGLESELPSGQLVGSVPSRGVNGRQEVSLALEEVQNLVRNLQTLAPLLSSLLPGLQNMGGQFVTRLAERQAARLVQDLARLRGPFPSSSDI